MIAAGSGSSARIATIRSSALSGPPGANTTSTPGTSTGSSGAAPSKTTVTSSPRSASDASSAASSRIAAGRSRHQPVGREPTTFMPSISQRVI